MTDYTDTIYLYQQIDGYNPPNQYKLITSASDVEELLTVGDNDYSCKGKYAINGSLASVDIITTKDYNGNTNIRTDYSIVCVQADGIKEFFIGNIVKREILSPTSVRFIFNIDWYTSQFCTAYFYSNKSIVPTAHHFIERRSSTGRFDYIDDGFTPKYRYVKSVKNIKWSSQLSSPTFTNNLFVSSTSWGCLLLIYNDASTNTIHWIGQKFRVIDSPIDPSSIWGAYYLNRLNPSEGIPNEQAFNSSQVLFYGYLPINPDCLDNEWNTDSNNGMYCFNPVTVSDSKFVLSADPRTSKTITVQFTCKSTDMDEFTLRDNDGTTIWNIPKGIDIDWLTFYVYINPDISTPSITFSSVYKNETYSDQFTFTITAKPLTYMLDAESVYYAEQRVYNQEMRSFTNMNQLVSGLRGSVTEGSMMYAFSRNDGARKGLTGGGISAAATIFNYAYTEQYANKNQTDIEDKQAKVSGDTLSFSSNLSVQSLDNMGLWEVKYDDDTIRQITQYHSQFGYQSDGIGKGLALNFSAIQNFEGYIQADITMEGGLRKEVEDYICKMFSYGITFTKFSTS